MRFTIETQYDQKAMKAMVRGLRKTVRQKRSRRSHRVGWFTVFVGILLILSATQLNVKVVLTFLAVAAIAAALIWEDSINAYVARKRGVPGLERSVTTFHENGYHSVTAVGESEFYYERIVCIAESDDYLIFILGPSHGQVFDLRTLEGGSKAAFYACLKDKTGKEPMVV